MQISVVVPAYNEENSVAGTIQDIKSFLKNNFDSYEIIVVNDYSQDDTLEILKKFDGIKLISNLKNHGKGYTVKKGVMMARGDLILFMDADNSTNISELNNFLPYIKDYDLVIASRGLPESKIDKKQSSLKVFLGKFGNLISKIMIDKNINDTQCGFKLFKKEIKNIFKQLTIDGFAFDFELIFLANRYNYKIKELPVTWTNDIHSSVRWYSYPNSLYQIFKIRLNNLLGKYNKK